MEHNRNNMSDSPAPLARLKRRLERLERPRHRGGARVFSFGCDALDARLDGGLARGALHELCAGASEGHAAASGFALMLAARASGEKPILWVREDKGVRQHGRLYAPGLVELGIDPARIILMTAPDTLSALRVGADILGCMAIGAAVIEPWGEAKKLDLTASRRLVLAAEKSRVAAFVLRDTATDFASAAATRWSVAAAPSTVLPGNAPGPVALAIELVRHRGGIAPFEMTLEWDRDEHSFRKQALSRAVFPIIERRPLAA
jgi:protein ImuA